MPNKLILSKLSYQSTIAWGGSIGKKLRNESSESLGPPGLRRSASCWPKLSIPLGEDGPCGDVGGITGRCTARGGRPRGASDWSSVGFMVCCSCCNSARGSTCKRDSGPLNLHSWCRNRWEVNCWDLCWSQVEHQNQIQLKIQCQIANKYQKHTPSFLDFTVSFQTFKVADVGDREPLRGCWRQTKKTSTRVAWCWRLLHSSGETGGVELHPFWACQGQRELGWWEYYFVIAAFNVMFFLAFLGCKRTSPSEICKPHIWPW